MSKWITASQMQFIKIIIENSQENLFANFCIHYRNTKKRLLIPILNVSEEQLNNSDQGSNEGSNDFVQGLHWVPDIHVGRVPHIRTIGYRISGMPGIGYTLNGVISLQTISKCNFSTCK